MVSKFELMKECLRLLGKVLVVVVLLSVCEREGAGEEGWRTGSCFLLSFKT